MKTTKTMKTTKRTTTTASVRKADASLDAALNQVKLGSQEIVSWSVAFPRSVPGTSGRLAETHTAKELPQPMWRTDATVGSVLGALGCMAAPSTD